VSAPAFDRPTWLCPDQPARQRLLDMDARLQRPRSIAFAVLGAAVLSTVPYLGLWPSLFLITVIAGFGGVTVLARRAAHPEYGVFGAWAFGQVTIATAIAMTGGIDSFAMSWMLVPIVTLAARFNARGVTAGVLLTALLMLVVTLVVPAGDPGPEAYGVIFPVAGLLAAGLLSTALMHSDLAHRTESVIDGLTGLLNRRALEHRLEELEAQAAVTGEPVAVIAGDLDRFKAINDEHGHALGDAVLVDVAYRLRKGLRAFDLAYRLGGEEFLILLPGATVGEATAIAEELREAVSAEPIEGLTVTISFGVAGSSGAFERERVLAAADAALYRAKDAGRNRVERADAALLTLV
jgi:diguanylate cyclase (GGDEF)-like protein